MPYVDVSGLCIAARRADGIEHDIVHDVGFSLERGQVLALIGESGSGKTTIALSLLGYTRPGCRIRAGRLTVGHTDVRALPKSAIPGYRGRRVSYIAQSAAASFNPAHRLLDQVVEGCVVRRQLTRPAATAKAIALFDALSLPDPARIGQRFPHQVSGGQLQRIMAAMALMTDPELVVLDEPTTALDVTTQAEVLRAFRAVVRDRGATAVYVSHDLAVVAQVADHIVVLKDGQVQETGATAPLLAAPANPYTISLLAAVPNSSSNSLSPRERTGVRGSPQTPPLPQSPSETSATPPVLEAQNLFAAYGPARGKGDGIPVLRDVTLRLQPGAVLGVIGESGSGKSTLARVLTGLLPARSGHVTLDGQTLPPTVAARTREQLRRMQIVFQMADTAMNPAHTVERILSRPLAFFHGMDAPARTRRVAGLLDMVRLSPRLAKQLPRDLSGGQKQRVNLARALAAEPAVLICDEVTSALDTVVGAAVLDLLAELRRELGMALLFISHDLATVRSIADEIMVMYAGRTIQAGPANMLRAGPLHPYTALLSASVPELRTDWLDGVPPEPRQAQGVSAHGAAWSTPGESCAFQPRCPVRLDGVCETEPTPVWTGTGGALIRCIRDEPGLAAKPPALAPTVGAEP